MSCKPTKITEERIDTAWSTAQDAVDADHVHVQLVYDEDGHIVSLSFPQLKSAGVHTLFRQVSCKAKPVNHVESESLVMGSSIDGKASYMQSSLVSESVYSTQELSTHGSHTVDLSDGKRHPPSSLNLTVATLLVRPSAPPSPALSVTSTLVGDVAPPKAKELPDVTDFEAIKVLGRGAQGVVTLVRNKSTGLCHALKSVNVTKLGAALYIRSLEEQDVLKRLAGIPWFVELHASFYDRKHFFFATVRVSRFLNAR